MTCPAREAGFRPNIENPLSGGVLLLLLLIAVPDPLDSMREELGLGVADSVTGILAEEILVFIALRFQDFRHAMIGFDPIVHVITHNIRVKKIVIAHRKEETNRFLWA